MKAWIISTSLLLSGLAFAAEQDGDKKPEKCPPHRPHPACTHGDKAKATYDDLNVEVKEITHGKLTISIKHSGDVVCRKVTGEKGEFYGCCVIKHKPEKPGSESALDVLSDDFGLEKAKECHKPHPKGDADSGSGKDDSGSGKDDSGSGKDDSGSAQAE